MIPQIQPWIDDSELDYLKQVVKSTYVTEHLLTEEFENGIKDLTKSKHAIAVCNGTAALFCCLKALGIGDGDEVIVPNLTFIATANAVIMAGATPVLCDVNESDLSLNLEKAVQCLSTKTKAIMPVHLYGHASNMDDILGFSKEHGIKVVEDAAQGVGVSYKKQHVGTFGDLGILSFYGNKTMTCGEGGVILTDDDELAEKCYRLKNHGRSSKGVFVHETVGFNFCFTEMQAAIGLAQLDKLPQIISRKQEIRDKYCGELKDILKPLQPNIKEESPVYWFTSFLVSPEEKIKLVKSLKERFIQTRDFFYPLDKQPCYRGLLDMAPRCDFSGSHNLYQQGISLPSSCELSDEDQDKIINAIRDEME